MIKQSNIFLIGFMGAGKTTIGKSLSQKLEMPFLDLDNEVSAFCKSTITDIFKEKGEDFFRDIETKVLKKILRDNSNAVISTGGGVVLKEENWNIMNSFGKVIYLQTDINNIWKRIKNGSSRPLLNVENAYKKANDLYNFRKPLYERADIIVDTDDLLVNEAVEKILKLLG